MQLKDWWNKKVVVLGDLIADVYVTGSISRMSREAPIPVVVEQDRKIVLGGAGNVIANIKALGGEPIPVCAVGSDETGKLLDELLHHQSISLSNVQYHTWAINAVKTRVISQNNNSTRQQLFRLDKKNPNKINEDDLIDKLYLAINHAHALIVSDYKEGMITNKIIATVNKIALSGFPVFVDSPRFNEFMYAHVLKPNEAELFNRGPITEKSLNAVGRHFVGSTECKNLLVTRGRMGMSLFYGNKVVNVPAHGTSEVADVIGAGDTVIATFTLATLAGYDAEDAMTISNMAGGIKVTKFGTVPVTFHELHEAFYKE